ncbi:hypothetical protein FQN54_007499 [Arachnomyces sp. PD_36]|nr:hypothetical protein FQN54_007499 [Arachnomyces sp. PD_36]
MPKRIHNPFPASLNSECKKAGEILERFVNPESFSTPGREISAKVLTGAKVREKEAELSAKKCRFSCRRGISNSLTLLYPQGLAILTVSKAGFMGAARIGSGIVVARLDDGTWSAPSALMLTGASFGGQIGSELADFVFILNTESAVRAFSQSGALTLGGNISLAFGPFGRNAEGAGIAGTKGVASVFAYSTTRGLFGGVSVEGSVLVGRSRANRKIYGDDVTAQKILSGGVQPPPAAELLMQILNSHSFSPEAARETPAEPDTAQPEHPAEPPPAMPSEAPTIPPLDFSHDTNHEPGSEIPCQGPSEEPPKPIPEHPVAPPPEPPTAPAVSQNTPAGA